MKGTLIDVVVVNGVVVVVLNLVSTIRERREWETYYRADCCNGACLISD